jgi:hypothetical protein
VMGSPTIQANGKAPSKRRSPSIYNTRPPKAAVKLIATAPRLAGENPVSGPERRPAVFGC